MDLKLPVFPGWRFVYGHEYIEEGDIWIFVKQLANNKDPFLLTIGDTPATGVKSMAIGEKVNQGHRRRDPFRLDYEGSGLVLYRKTDRRMAYKPHKIFSRPLPLP